MILKFIFKPLIFGLRFVWLIYLYVEDYYHNYWCSVCYQIVPLDFGQPPASFCAALISRWQLIKKVGPMIKLLKGSYTRMSSGDSDCMWDGHAHYLPKIKQHSSGSTVYMVNALKRWSWTFQAKFFKNQVYCKIPLRKIANWGTEVGPIISIMTVFLASNIRTYS